MTDTLTPIQTELLKRADSVYDSLSRAVTTATDFAAQQIPDVAYQYLVYYRVYLTTIVCVFTLMWVLQQTVMIKWAKATDKYFERNNLYNEGHHWFIYVLTTIVVSMICATTIFSHFKELLMVWFAPKVFLLEQLTNLIKH